MSVRRTPVVRPGFQPDQRARDRGFLRGVHPDAERGVRFAVRIEAGMSHVNNISVEDEPHMAFGGEKHSGIG